MVTSSYILFHAVYFKGIWEGMKKSTTSCRTMRTYGSESVKCTAISLFLTLHCVYVHLCPTSSLLNFNSACRRAGKVNIFLPKQRYMRVQFAAYMWAVRLIMEVFLSSAISLSSSLTWFTTGVDIAMER